MDPDAAVTKLSRRSVLGISVSGLIWLSGCAKLAARSADEVAGAAKGADEVADGAKGADEAVDGAKASDDAADGAKASDDAVDGSKKSNGDDGSTDGKRKKPDLDLSTATPTESESLDEKIEDVLPILSVDDTYSIEEGYYLYWELLFTDVDDSEYSDVELSYEVSVIEGSTVDVFLIPLSELESFENSSEFQYYTGASEMNTTAIEMTSAAGFFDYALVIDNSDMGSIADSGATEVSVSISAHTVE